MRVELFEVRFNNSNSVYIAGQSVSGKVVIKLAKETYINTINIVFRGRAKSKWDVPDGDVSKIYQAQEVYMDNEYQLYKSRGQQDSQPAGMHVYPFDFTLPHDIPSSFEGRRGCVRYQCIVTLDRGWKGVMQIEQDLTVIRHFDLNNVYGAANPQSGDAEEIYEGCCCDSGHIHAYLSLQKSGFVPGEPMHYSIRIENKATTSISGVVMSLVQIARYTGYSDSLFSSGNPKFHDKVNNWGLLHCDDEVGAGTVSILNSQCTIPAVAPSLLEGCSIIDINYEIRLDVPAGWQSLQLRCKIFIGTIPLRQSEVQSNSNVDLSHVDLDVISPPMRQSAELPPSYEECVFGRMESQEGTNDVLEDEDETVDGNASSRAGSTTASRRSRFHRLPSYPYYNTDSFTNGAAPPSENSQQDQFGSQQSNNYRITPPPPFSSSASHNSEPITDQPSSSLPPPPSYESLQLQYS